MASYRTYVGPYFLVLLKKDLEDAGEAAADITSGLSDLFDPSDSYLCEMVNDIRPRFLLIPWVGNPFTIPLDAEDGGSGVWDLYDINREREMSILRDHCRQDFNKIRLDPRVAGVLLKWGVIRYRG